MPKERSIPKGINSVRLELSAKGYIRQSESGEYLGVSVSKGRAIYKELKHDLEANGVKVNSCGISPEVFNKFLGISEEQIVKYSQMGY